MVTHHKVRQEPKVKASTPGFHDVAIVSDESKCLRRSWKGRGRDRGFPRPPAQIRAGRITALGFQRYDSLTLRRAVGSQAACSFQFQGSNSA